MLAHVKATRVNNAYEQLKADILLGELPPGFQAPEPEIAARLDMSRTPVREALIRLETDGLVELIPRRGAKVLSIGARDLTDIMEILSALEPMAVITVMRQGVAPEACQELSEALDAADKALEDGDFCGWAECDDRFHRLLGRWSNWRLKREIGVHLDQIHRALRVLTRLNGGPSEQPDDHRDLLAAMLSGDRNKAADIARAHRINALQSMSALFENSGVTHL